MDEREMFLAYEDMIRNIRIAQHSGNISIAHDADEALVEITEQMEILDQRMTCEHGVRYSHNPLWDGDGCRECERLEAGDQEFERARCG